MLLLRNGLPSKDSARKGLTFFMFGKIKNNAFDLRKHHQTHKTNDSFVKKEEF